MTMRMRWLIWVIVLWICLPVYAFAVDIEVSAPITTVIQTQEVPDSPTLNLAISYNDHSIVYEWKKQRDAHYAWQPNAVATPITITNNTVNGDVTLSVSCSPDATQYDTYFGTYDDLTIGLSHSDTGEISDSLNLGTINGIDSDSSAGTKTLYFRIVPTNSWLDSVPTEKLATPLQWSISITPVTNDD